MEYLLRAGSDRVIQDACDHIYNIRGLQEFRYTDSEHKERGSGIRSLSKSLVELLNDSAKLKALRKETQKNKDKFVGISGGGSSAVSYDSHSGFGGNDSNNGFENDTSFDIQKDLKKKKKKKNKNHEEKKKKKKKKESSDEDSSDSDR